MKNIVMNTLAKINKDSTLDEIKAVMKAECAKVDWQDVVLPTTRHTSVQSVKYCIL